jgi:outer membrane receptor for ferrienterochelin and colicins
MRGFTILLASAAVALACAAPPARAQAVTGVILDSLTRVPLPGSAVRVIDSTTGGVTGETTSNGRGRFRLSGTAGGHRLRATMIGYAPRELPLPPPGALLVIALQPVQYLQEQVVTPGRTATTIAAAEASVSLLPRDELERRLGPDGPTGRLRDVSGIYLARKGLVQHTFAARGPGAVNSGSLLLLTDYRLASVPALRLNVPYLVPPSVEDMDRIEVVRGPGSALYGPDADRGIVHLITRSPLDAEETAGSLTVGERSLVEASVRHADRIGSAAGVKLSGGYVRGDDWPEQDPNEVMARDPGLERAAGEARVDMRLDGRTTLVVAGGVAQAIRLVDLTEVGAVQLRNWRSGFVQARLERGPLFANLFANLNDAGESFQLRTGAPVIDDSRTYSAQLQHGTAVGRKVGLRYGAEVQRIVPETGGTVHGRNEADDEVTQLGGYLHATWTPSPGVDLIGGARVDYHSRLHDLAISPRLGVLIRPGASHTIRATYNRATSTPVATDLFLDLVSGTIPLDPANPALGYTVRAVGTADTYTFRRDCGGALALCMRSPFIPPAGGGPGQYIPADATLLWEALQQAAGGLLDGVPAPTPAQVPTTLGVLDLGADTFVPIARDAVADLPSSRRVVTNTVEIGYVGQPLERLTLAIDLHRTRTSSVGNGLTALTPNVFIDGPALAAYLTGLGFPPSAASQLGTELARLPLGTVSPVEARDPTDILVAARQSGPGTYWGADISVEVALAPGASVRGAYSWISRELFRNALAPGDVALNVPRHRGALGLRLEWPAAGMGTELRARAQNAFPVISGEYSGVVPGFAELDATVTWRLPWARHISISLAALNLFDREHREFVGAPLIRRLLLTRVRAAF